jgi:hypothetical protein
MRIRVVLVLVSLLCARLGSAQTVPVIRAHSRVVTITDGLHLKKNYWYVMPERVPDVYYVEIPLQPHTVTFTTDAESISFHVTFGSQHDFIIKLDDGVEARTQVRAAFRHLLSCRRERDGPVPRSDVVPFTVGDNDKIYVKGRINDGPLLDLQFDLGAGGSIIKKSSVPKANMTFDGTITLTNSDGTNVVPSSSRNRLEIADLRCEAIGFAVADNMTHREDGLIGNGLFQDKVVEIDYDRQVIAIHETLPPLSADWIASDMILDGVIPFVRGTLTIDGDARDGWLMLDTGAYTSILSSARLSPVSKAWRELRGLAGSRGGLSVSIGGRTFANPNYSVRAYDGDQTALGLAGNDVLKRFNLIVDNRRGIAYFRPNRHLDDPFRNPEYSLVRFAGLFLVVVTAGAYLVASRRRR